MSSSAACCKKHSSDSYATAAVAIVHDVAFSIRNRGLTLKQAMPLAAERLNINPYRFQRIFFEGTFKVLRDEFEGIAARYFEHLAAEEYYLHDKIAENRRKMKQMEQTLWSTRHSLPLWCLFFVALAT